jgi:hypothetical protein
LSFNNNRVANLCTERIFRTYFNAVGIFGGFDGLRQDPASVDSGEFDVRGCLLRYSVVRNGSVFWWTIPGCGGYGAAGGRRLRMFRIADGREGKRGTAISLSVQVNDIYLKR